MQSLDLLNKYLGNNLVQAGHKTLQHLQQVTLSHFPTTIFTEYEYATVLNYDVFHIGCKVNHSFWNKL